MSDIFEDSKKLNLSCRIRLSPKFRSLSSQNVLVSQTPISTPGRLFYFPKMRSRKWVTGISSNIYILTFSPKYPHSTNGKSSGTKCSVYCSFLDQPRYYKKASYDWEEFGCRSSRRQILCLLHFFWYTTNLVTISWVIVPRKGKYYLLGHRHWFSKMWSCLDIQTTCIIWVPWPPRNHWFSPSRRFHRSSSRHPATSRPILALAAVVRVWTSSMRRLLLSTTCLLQHLFLRCIQLSPRSVDASG